MDIWIAHQAETPWPGSQLQLRTAELDRHVRPDRPPFEHIHVIAVLERIRLGFLHRRRHIVRLGVPKADDSLPVSNDDSDVLAGDLSLPALVNDALPEQHVHVLFPRRDLRPSLDLVLGRRNAGERWWAVEERDLGCLF